MASRSSTLGTGTWWWLWWCWIAEDSLVATRWELVLWCRLGEGDADEGCVLTGAVTEVRAMVVKVPLPSEAGSKDCRCVVTLSNLLWM